jgi:hypothetical protein
MPLERQPTHAHIHFSAEELSALLNLLMWLLVGMEEVHRHLGEGELDEAAALVRIALENECVQKDRAIVVGVADKLLPLLHKQDCATRIELLKRAFAEAVHGVVVEGKAIDALQHHGLRRQGGLPS